MARKAPRSQRRKKGQSMEGGDDDGDQDQQQQQFLDDDFTIGADTNIGSDWGSAQTDHSPEDDYYLEGGKDHADNAVAAAETRYLKLKDTLTLCDEFAAEKRTVKREASLKRLFKALAQYATGPAGAELVYQWSDNIRDAAFHGIRVGNPPEQYAALRVLEVTSIILGADNQDEWCEKLDRQLRSVVMATQRAAPVRMAALRALTMAVFICSSDSMTTEGLMDLCEQVAAKEFRNEKVQPILRATALDCWALLATTILDYHLAGQDDAQMGRGLAILELLRECLNDTSIDLRSAAGECFSLIHEAKLSLGVGDDEGENTTARRFRRGSWDGSQWEVIMDEVKQRIAELSVESGHHLSRKVKKEQRSTFREFMQTIVEDEAPEEVVAFRGGRLSMNNWKEIIQLNFVRHCLQGGFQIQILTNETLHQIFGANGQLLMENASMSQLEKRLIMSKTSDSAKAADLDLKANRKKRQNVKNHFLTADGDDL